MVCQLKLDLFQKMNSGEIEEGAMVLRAKIDMASPNMHFRDPIILARVDEIADNAIADACTGSNPRIPNHDEMVALLKACYYDTEVDF